jgi:RING finger protein 170
MLLVIVGALGYLVSPIDLIPEVVFGVVGLIDDFFIIFVVLIGVAQSFRNVLIEHNNE